MSIDINTMIARVEMKSITTLFSPNYIVVVAYKQMACMDLLQWAWVPVIAAQKYQKFYKNTILIVGEVSSNFPSFSPLVSDQR